ncbi:MAG: GatB/YqeY domain-containing protein [Candidatus Moranbacteria bacterium]|nr:GatB/YqeY domain-containing protein [Candidatus Moranbacteria bacterium]
MTLYETIHNDLKEAMKAGDAARRDVLRMVGSALKNEAIELRKAATELADTESVVVLRRLAKQRRESIASFLAGGRADLAGQEESELAIIGAYLPANLPDDEIRKLVGEAKAETGAASKADFGKLMGAASKKVAGRADGATVRRFVEEALAE